MLTCLTRAEPGSHLTGALCPRIPPSPMMTRCAVANFGNGFDEPLLSNGDVPQPRHGLRAALARQVQDAGHVLDEGTGEERRRDVRPSNDIRRPTPDAIWGGAGQMTGPEAEE
jgi:hypothetical protein